MLVMDPAGAVSSPPPPALKPQPPEPFAPPGHPDSVALTPPQAPSLANALVCASGGSGAQPGGTQPIGLLSNVLKGAATPDYTAWFPQGPLPPSAMTVDSNGYRYTSDMFGRPLTASGDLHLSPTARTPRTTIEKTNQLGAGGPDRLAGDHGGHGIGRQFGGLGDEWNLVPQNGNYNQSAYTVMENSWQKTLQQPGGTVQTSVRHVYDSPTLRPTHEVATYSLDGDAPVLRVMENAPQAGASSSVAGIGRSEAFLNGMGHVSQGLDTFGKVAAPVAVAADGYRLYSAFQQDGDTVGKHTLETGGSVAGGWAGAVAGGEMGADAGAAVGAFFGGVGAVPGAIVGGLVGGVVGGIAGSEAGTDIVKFGESAVGAVEGGAKAVAHAGSDVVHGIGHAASKVASFFGL